MKRTLVYICFAFCAVSVLSLAEDGRQSKPSATVSPPEEFSLSIDPNTTLKKTTTTAHPKTTTLAPNTTTTAHPKTTTLAPNKTTTAHPKTTTLAPNKTTTAHPKTTTLAPNTTTPHPKTTTLAPNTTTPHPKTTTLAPNTTTPHPKTTTQSPPTPPKPTPSANLTTGSYNLTNDKKEICLMAQMALQIRLVSPKANGSFIVQPKLMKPFGGCKDTKGNLTLRFKEGFITFMFNKTATEVYVDAVSFSLSYPLSKGGNGPFTANNKSVHLFPAKVGHSYSCKKDALYMGNGLYLDVDQDRMQAFNLTKSKEFGTSDLCAADRPDYRVAIAVGVTLLVLIIIVVVAYLIGRRKRTGGYQSL